MGSAWRRDSENTKEISRAMHHPLWLFGHIWLTAYKPHTNVSMYAVCCKKEAHKSSIHWSMLLIYVAHLWVPKTSTPINTYRCHRRGVPKPWIPFFHPECRAAPTQTDMPEVPQAIIADCWRLKKLESWWSAIWQRVFQTLLHLHYVLVFAAWFFSIHSPTSLNLNVL